MYMNALREMKLEDKWKIFVWRNLPEVSKYMYTDHKITESEHEEWFEHIINDRTRKYWIIVSDQEDVGLANLYNINSKNKYCYWAFYLASPNVRGKGVGSFVEYSILEYVLKNLSFNKLCCEVISFNQAVTNMHKSFGFVEEGFYRQHIFRDGEFLDVVALAILASEWNEKKPEIEERLKNKGII